LKDVLSRIEHAWQLPAEVPPGPWRERRRLAAALRALSERCVRADASEETLRAAAALAEQALAPMAAARDKTYLGAMKDGWQSDDPREYADRGVLIGRSNPLAPPMHLSSEAGVAVGELVFSPSYEGAPGWVHGGLVAAAIDQVLGFLQIHRGIPSVTGRLTVHYRRPTPIETPIRIEARAGEDRGRQCLLSARLFCGGEVSAEAEGVFVRVDADALWPGPEATPGTPA